MEGWKIIFSSRWVICRFHVDLPGCSLAKDCVLCVFNHSFIHSSMFIHPVGED